MNIIYFKPPQISNSETKRRLFYSDRNRDRMRRQLHEDRLVTTQRHQHCILVITELILASEARWGHSTPTYLCIVHLTVTIHSILKQHILVLGDPHFILMRSCFLSAFIFSWMHLSIPVAIWMQYGTTFSVHLIFVNLTRNHLSTRLIRLIGSTFRLVELFNLNHLFL